MEYNKFKKVSIKIYKCFYLDDIIKFQDFGSDIVFYWMKCGTRIFYSIGIRLDKIEGIIEVYDSTRYFVLFGPEKYDAIYKKIK